jgi:hypothetical protein
MILKMGREHRWSVSQPSRLGDGTSRVIFTKYRALDWAVAAGDSLLWASHKYYVKVNRIGGEMLTLWFVGAIFKNASLRRVPCTVGAPLVAHLATMPVIWPVYSSGPLPAAIDRVRLAPHLAHHSKLLVSRSTSG